MLHGPNNLTIFDCNNKHVCKNVKESKIFNIFTTLFPLKRFRFFKNVSTVFITTIKTRQNIKI